MKEVTEFHISISRTFNLGNYNSLKVEAGITVTPELPDGVKLSEYRAYYEKLWEEAQDELRRRFIETFDIQKRDI